MRHLYHFINQAIIFMHEKDMLLDTIRIVIDNLLQIVLYNVIFM